MNAWHALLNHYAGQLFTGQNWNRQRWARRRFLPLQGRQVLREVSALIYPTRDGATSLHLPVPVPQRFIGAAMATSQVEEYVNGVVTQTGASIG